MKNFVLLFVLFFLFKPIFPVLDYVINYDYITTELCENKNKPEMACNGKCHLMKELAKSAEKESPISTDKNNTVKEIDLLFIEPVQNFDFIAFVPAKKNVLITDYTNLYTFESVSKNLRPPSYFIS